MILGKRKAKSLIAQFFVLQANLTQNNFGADLL
jgi:hypothetical protein